MEITTISPRKKVLFGGLIFFLLVIIGVITFVFYQKTLLETSSTNQNDETSAAIELQKRKQDQNNAYYESLLTGNPVLLQDQFVQDVQNGVNDAYTKSAVYFITHRYFDNNGNIYEIYDFINSRPELAFLKEAEKIFPAIFKEIENGTAPKEYSSTNKLAYLAYLKILDDYGYADVATQATSANQHIKLTYLYTKIPNQFSSPEEKDMGPTYIKYENQRAVYFAEKARPDVVKILNGELTDEDLPKQDILIGLNQYASAIRYFDILGIAFNPEKSAEEIFAFSTEYARTRVPELYIFTNFLNASTLAMNASSSVEEIEKALTPIIIVDEKLLASMNPSSVIKKILNAKNEKLVYFSGTNVRDLNLELYGKTNVVVLAKKVPTFKAWLLKNGWNEVDFDWEYDYDISNT